MLFCHLLAVFGHVSPSAFPFGQRPLVLCQGITIADCPLIYFSCFRFRDIPQPTLHLFGPFPEEVTPLLHLFYSQYFFHDYF
jgi:hypothetical protein